MNSIIIFEPDMAHDNRDYPQDGLHSLYKIENSHFWFLNRKEYIADLFDRYISKNNKIIEVGAGTGNVSNMLRSRGYSIAAGELHIEGLRMARGHGLCELYQFDIFNPPFREHFDTVCAFDVIEHFDNDTGALKKIHGMLKNDGQVIITVPAHRWLWNSEDVLARHKRRYDLKRIRSIFTASGFEIIETRHFFTFIIPLLFIRRFINRDMVEDRQHEIKINPVINGILYYITKLEFFLTRRLKPRLGGSISVVAMKVKS
jgi:SAM-dependent methyltransferase